MYAMRKHDLPPSDGGTYIELKYVDVRKEWQRRVAKVFMMLCIMVGIIFSVPISTTDIILNEKTADMTEIKVNPPVEEENPITLNSVYPTAVNTELNIGTNIVKIEPEFVATETVNKEMYAIDLVNVRTSPTTEEDNIFKVADYGDQITVLEKSEEWYKVLFKGKECYIHNGLLSETKPEMYRYRADDEEYAILCRIVEAEVTGNTGKWHGVSDDDFYMSKLRVAQNILNRVECVRYPDTIEGVVFQKGQYSPIGDGRYWKVTVTDMTRRAVNEALKKPTPDYTQNAIYFRDDGRSFSQYGEYLFTDALGIQFYGSYKCSCH